MHFQKSGLIITMVDRPFLLKEVSWRIMEHTMDCTNSIVQHTRVFVLVHAHSLCPELYAGVNLHYNLYRQETFWVNCASIGSVNIHGGYHYLVSCSPPFCPHLFA